MNSGDYCLLGISWHMVCLSKDEWASWVMAIGSVLAVIAAIYVPYRQDQNNRRAQKTEAFEKNLGYMDLCIEFSDEVEIAMAKVLEKFMHDHQKSPKTSYDRLKTLQETSLILLGKDLPSDCSLIIIKLGAILSLTLAYVDASEDEDGSLSTLQANVQEQLLHALDLNQRMKSIAAAFRQNSLKSSQQTD